MAAQNRGILYPDQLPDFHRLPAPPSVAPLVSWFWIPEWELPPGRTSLQHVIAHPAANLVVQPDGVELAGPATRASHRELAGRGWAVGALLRPAAARHLAKDVPGGLAGLRDAVVTLPAPELQAAVVHAMTGPDPADPGSGDEASGEADGVRRDRAVAAFAAWLARHIPEPGPEALLANGLVELVMAEPHVVRVADAASRLGVSVRTLQRLAADYVGLGPAAMIRRRRLQEAAERLRTAPGTDLAQLAAELGYADQAHLANDFRQVLGLAPGSYRRIAAPDSAAPDPAAPYKEGPTA